MQEPISKQSSNTDKLLNHYDIVIIGSGLSGLASAYYLRKNKPDLNIGIISNDSHLGGVIQSKTLEDESQMIYELGPNTLLGSYSELREIIMDLNLEEEVIEYPLSKSTRYIYDKKIMRPLMPKTLSMTKYKILGFKDILQLSLKLIQDLFRLKPAIKPNETVAEFCYRKLGKTVSHKLVFTFLKGVWAGNPEKLLAKYALKKLVKLELDYGSIIYGLIKSKQSTKIHKNTSELKQNLKTNEGKVEAKQKSLSTILSFKKGLSTLTKAMVRDISQQNILLNSEILNIQSIVREEHSDTNYRYEIQLKTSKMLENNDENSQKIIRSIKTHKIIFSCPAYSSAQLLTNLDSTASVTNTCLALKQITYAPMHMYVFSIPRSYFQDKLSGFGFLNTSSTDKVLGNIWASELFIERKHSDKYIFICFAGGDLNQEIRDFSCEEYWQQYIKTELEEIYYNNFAVNSSAKPELELIDFKSWNKAIPQYHSGHEELIKELVLLRGQGIYFSGNYIDGISMPDTILQAKNIAETILQI